MSIAPQEELRCGRYLRTEKPALDFLGGSQELEANAKELRELGPTLCAGDGLPVGVPRIAAQNTCTNF